MLKKNSVHAITIEDIGVKGEGIGRLDNFVVFVDNCLPGDICEIAILKSKKSHAYGKILKIIKPSPQRVSPVCKASSRCGGCSLMHMDYKSQLQFKEKKVKDSIKRIAGIENPPILSIKSMENIKGYRNKAQIPVREENGRIKIGYYAKNSHRIVEEKSCYIQQDCVNQIVSVIRVWMEENSLSAYNEISQKGLIRHILVKQAFSTDQILIGLVLNQKSGFLPRNYNSLIEKLTDIKGLTGVFLNYNNRNTNVIMGSEINVIWGKAYIVDQLGDLSFKISAHSFFQINPIQALEIYNCAVEFSSVTENDIVIDAYCGIGTISLFFAKKAKYVYGVEIVAEAVEDAILNARQNQLTNTEFFCGQSENIIFDLIDRNIKADILIVDPPRKGCERQFLEAIESLNPKKIIYISCNPDTLSRDMKILKEYNYYPDKIKPFDMFSHTTHIECVASMSKH